MFRHNTSHSNHNHLYKGVAIVLSPRYYEGWIAAGKLEPKIVETAGRIISLTIKLECYNKHCQKIRGKNGSKHITLSLVSAYHPYQERCKDENEYSLFVDKLDAHLEEITRNNNTEIIMGADVNADIGCHNDRQMEEYKQVLGPNGLHKRNFKGKTLLHLYLLHNLRVTNTFYIPKDSGPH